jgi:hypothetical protein
VQECVCSKCVRKQLTEVPGSAKERPYLSLRPDDKEMDLLESSRQLRDGVLCVGASRFVIWGVTSTSGFSLSLAG